METKNNQRRIREAIRKIALGRSIDRVDMSHCGTGGVGTARLIHGYVAKINNEDDEYLGTIDVGEFPDETASSEPVIHKGVLLSGLQDNSGGFLIVPTLFSDVTIVTDAATKYAYVVNFSHADFIQILSHTESVIGVSETEELDAESNDSPDYDRLEKTGNESSTRYTAEAIQTLVKNKNDKQAEITVNAENITQKIDKSRFNQTADKLEQHVNGTSVVVADKKVTIGSEDASEPLVLGNELAQLMLDFITECSKIMTPTLMGTMPAVNSPNFPSLASKIQKFLSKTAYTK